MDSPEGNRIVPTSSASPPFQESPFSNFVRTLSPINSVKSNVQGFPKHNIPLLPPVFTSPRIITQHSESFLKRPQFSHPSNAELSLQNDSYKMVGGASDISNSSRKESVQVHSCSPSECVDEFLADPVDPEDSVNSIPLVSLEQTNGAPKALESTSSLKENIEKVYDKVDSRKGTDTEAMTEPVALLKQAEEEVPVKLLFPDDPVESEVEQQKDCEMLLGEHKRVNSEKIGALAESGLFIQHDSVAQNDKNLVFQISKDLSSIYTMEEEHEDADFDKRQRPNCSTNLCSHRSEDVTMQNAEGRQQDELDCTPQLLPESLQIPQAFQDHNEKSGLLPNESLESRMQCDFEEASQHQRGTLRRCLQFEAAGGQRNVAGSVGQNPENMTPRTSDLGDLDLCDLVPSVASSPKQPLDLSQPAPSKLSHSLFQSSDTRVDKSVRDCGHAAVTAPVPTGIGLHLNSMVHSSARVSGITRSMKSVEKRHVNVQQQKSFCVTNIHFQDDSNSSSLPLKMVGENSSLVDDTQQESQAIVLTTSDSSQLPDNMNAMKTPQQLQLSHSIPTRKRKYASESADIVEEFNHPSPKKGRRKASSSTQNDGGCKRCNCKRSKCLKLYCECFAAGVYCADPCACQECFNKPEHEDTVLGVRQQIESRNPLAFAPKIVQRVSESSANSGEESNRMTPSSARHKRGCNCKKSMCLKKYCECYQSGVGCSEACRCEGCKNVYGLKEEFIYRRVVDERWEDLSDEKLDMVEVRRDHSHREHSHPESLSPLTPSFDCSNHGKNVSKPRVPARRRLPSPESDSSALSSYGKSAGSPTNNYGKQQKMSEEVLDIVTYDRDLDCTNVGRVDQFTPRWDVLTQNCNFTPSLHPSRATASFFPSSSSDYVKVSGALSSCGSVHLSSVSSLRWQSSPITPMPHLGGNHFTPEMDSDNGLYDVLGDETPEILKDTATLVNVVKASSPNKKRVSPPHSRLHEVRPNSSTSLRSGRKFILQAVPSFPPLSPDCDPKGSGGDK